MDDDKTVLMPKGAGEHPVVGSIYVTWIDREGTTQSNTFARQFSVGRQSSCDLQIDGEGVSRVHADGVPTEHGWKLRDLGSANGLFREGQRVREVHVQHRTAVRLGPDGPVLWCEPLMQPEAPAASPSAHNTGAVSRQETSLTQAEIADHYFGDKPDEDIGDHTRMVRSAFKKVQQKQSRKYRWIMGGISLLLVVVIAVAGYQQLHLKRAKAIAIDMFYDMKDLQIQVARTESRIQRTGSLAQIADVKKKRQQLDVMQQRYRDYLTELETLSILHKKPSPEEVLILKVARQFGESELELPDGFVDEVKKYIKKWQSSRRLPLALVRMERQGYQPTIRQALKAQGLPEQFLYLSLQESNFKYDAIGPETRWGIAKGAWQFIPSTATEYGLKIGPLAKLSKYDPEDERFDFSKATYAAAKYLKYIYSMEAQASGLLVMASYNWGHNRVRGLVKKMPDNSRERNFWQLIKQYKIPKETYDYVFYIFSAAVIGEDPQQFGFSFDNPLSS